MQFYRVDINLAIANFVLATNKGTAAREAKREVNELILYLEQRGWDLVMTEVSEAVLLEDDDKRSDK